MKLWILICLVVLPSCSTWRSSYTREAVAEARIVACTACRGLTAAERGDPIEAVEAKLDALEEALEQIVELAADWKAAAAALRERSGELARPPEVEDQRQPAPMDGPPAPGAGDPQ